MTKGKRKKTSKAPSGKTALCLNSAFFGYYAHAGFVHGLSQLGFRPDVVTGCSSGAMVGALYCAGIDVDEIVRMMLQLKRRDFWEGSWITQLIKPIVHGFSRYSGALSGKKIRELLRPYLGGLDFENLKTPLGIAVSNITTGSRELRTSGNVLDSVMCSMAFPLLIEVQSMDGHEFIDGGVVDHEPIKELILDRSIKRIVVHNVETENGKQSRSPLLRAFHSSVNIIDRETRELKRLLASHRNTRITRVTTHAPRLGPDRTHLGSIALAAGQTSAAANAKQILNGKNKFNPGAALRATWGDLGQ